MLLLDEHIKENRFSTGSCLSIRMPENSADIRLKMGSTLVHLSYSGESFT